MPSEVYRLAIVRFILAMGNFVFPFLTLFLIKKLDISPVIVSVYYVATGLTFVPASMISGKIADKFGRRKIALYPFFIYILIIFTIFFLYHFNICLNNFIAILLVISSFFNAMTQTPINAIMTDVTNPKNRNEAFSLTYLANNLGFAFGPLMAGFLFENYTSFIFLGNGLFSLIGFLILVGIKETRPEVDSDDLQDDAGLKNDPQKKEKKDITNNTSVLSFILKDEVFLIFIISTILFSFAYSQAGFTLPIYLTSLFSSKGAKYYGILQSTNAITVIILTPIISSMTKKKSSFLMVGISGIFYAVGFGLYAFFNFMPLFALTTIIWSIGEIIQVTHQNVFVANKSPVSIRGQVNGTFYILSGLGFVLGPVFSGFYQKYFAIKYIWLVVLFLCFIGFSIIYLNYLKKKDKIIY